MVPSAAIANSPLISGFRQTVILMTSPGLSVMGSATRPFVAGRVVARSGSDCAGATSCTVTRPSTAKARHRSVGRTRAGDVGRGHRDAVRLVPELAGIVSLCLFFREFPEHEGSRKSQAW